MKPRWILLMAPTSLAPAVAADGHLLVKAPEGVIVDLEGNPRYGTFSLCAIDPETGQSGVAVTTRVPFVGRAVPWVRAGVGAVATQSWGMVEYGQQGLALLAEGVSPEEAIERLLADDVGPREKG